MRIDAIEIRNIKSIRQLSLENIPDLLVIAGPNGSGKTALFDAIRIFKEAFGGYSRRNPGQSLVDSIIDQVGPIVTIGEDRSLIEATVRVTEDEARAIELPDGHPKILTGRVEIAAVPAGQRERAQAHEDGGAFLRRLFGQMYQPDGPLGVVDHIGPDRRFARGAAASITFTDDYAETDLHRLVALSAEKFQSLSQDLIMMRMLDMLEREQGAENPARYIDGIREIFEHFLPDRRFLDIQIPQGFMGRPQVLVESGGVTHDINQLSSGQREILMTYTHLEKLRPTGSIILFDEPELHLHPALQRRVISHLHRLLERGSNQIWVITHSEEIVGTTEYESLFAMTGHGSPALIPVTDKAERLELLQSLGASIGLQLTSPRIHFVEGDSDAELLPLFSETLPAGLSIVATGGKSTLMRLTETALRLLEEVVATGQFFLVRDRDIEDDPGQIDELEQRYRGKFFSWDRYHIENYLLDETAIFAVLADDPDTPTPESEDFVCRELRAFADDQRPTVLAKRIESRLNRTLRQRIRLNPREGIEVSLQKAAESRLRTTQDLLDSAALAQSVQEETEQLDARWEAEWKSLCVGRDVLAAFVAAHVRDYLGYEVFRNRIARKMRDTGRVPRAISAVMDAASEGLPGTSR